MGANPGSWFTRNIIPHSVKAPVPITAKRIKIAIAVAVCADLIQIGLFPLVSEGIFSPLDDVLDVAVCIVLTLLVGWHFAFLPSFVVKVLPIADLVPTWTIATLIATRQKVPDSIPKTTVVQEEPTPILQLKEPADKPK
jgi:hypothetical protein